MSTETGKESSDEVPVPTGVEAPEDYEWVASVEDVPRMRPLSVEVDGRGVLVCLQDDEVRAVDEICPHEERSMRYGVVQGGSIVCPHHQYKFDLETGRCKRHKCEPATTYEVHLEDGEVFVKKQ